MPTTYAHWRFGDKCISTLPKELQEIINDNRDVFNFGVHGPDIFFYYKCIKHNNINQFGSDLHNTPFKDTLAKIKPIYNRMADQKGALSYLLGFCCHFTLDSYCHGYIDRKVEVSRNSDKPTSHGIIETQYDKYLMIKDGYNPYRLKVTKTLKPSKRIGSIVGQSFPEIGDEIAYKSLMDHKFYLDLLKDKDPVKRRLLEKIMDHYNVSTFKDLLLTNKEFPEIEDSKMRLDKYFNKALEHYKELATNLVDYLKNNKPLIDYFHNHFVPKEDYKNIPILSVEEERKYIVEKQV